MYLKSTSPWRAFLCKFLSAAKENYRCVSQIDFRWERQRILWVSPTYRCVVQIDSPRKHTKDFVCKLGTSPRPKSIRRKIPKLMKAFEYLMICVIFLSLSIFRPPSQPFLHRGGFFLCALWTEGVFWGWARLVLRRHDHRFFFFNFSVDFSEFLQLLFKTFRENLNPWYSFYNYSTGFKTAPPNAVFITFLHTF